MILSIFTDYPHINKYHEKGVLKMEFKSVKKSYLLSSCSFTTIIKNICISYFITLVLFLLLAFVMTYTNMSINIVSTLTIVITIISIIIAGILNGKKSSEKGWLTGIITGFLYMMLLYFTGCIAYNNFSITSNGITMIILGIFAGALGSIIGINNKKERYVRKYNNQ